MEQKLYQMIQELYQEIKDMTPTNGRSIVIRKDLVVRLWEQDMDNPNTEVRYLEAPNSAAVTYIVIQESIEEVLAMLDSNNKKLGK